MWHRNTSTNFELWSYCCRWPCYPGYENCKCICFECEMLQTNECHSCAQSVKTNYMFLYVPIEQLFFCCIHITEGMWWMYGIYVMMQYSITVNVWYVCHDAVQYNCEVNLNRWLLQIGPVLYWPVVSQHHHNLYFIRVCSKYWFIVNFININILDIF